MSTYPKIEKELCNLEQQDQEEVIALFSKTYDNEQFIKERLKIANNAMERVLKAEKLLAGIDPTNRNIGTNGSQAFITLVLHSKLIIMEKVAGKYLQLYRKDKESVPAERIPSLLDRISILKTRKQIYGTQWMNDENEQPFLIELHDYENVIKLRKSFNLELISLPHNLSKKGEEYPLGKGTASKSNMRPMSDKLYEQYSKYYL